MKSTLKKIWINTKSVVMTLVALVLIVPVLLGIFWLVPVILVVVGGLVLFVVFKAMNEDNDDTDYSLK